MFVGDVFGQRVSRERNPPAEESVELASRGRTLLLAGDLHRELLAKGVTVPLAEPHSTNRRYRDND